MRDTFTMAEVLEALGKALPSPMTSRDCVIERNLKEQLLAHRTSAKRASYREVGRHLGRASRLMAQTVSVLGMVGCICSCSVVSANRTFPKLAWYWSWEAKAERQERATLKEWQENYARTNTTKP